MIKQLFTVFSLLAASDELLKEVSTPLRPQEPKIAISYDAEEVKYSNLTADVTLAGTLTFPGQENHLLLFYSSLALAQLIVMKPYLDTSLFWS
jgi:hypothetical protein